jgi:hypothetical protein
LWTLKTSYWPELAAVTMAHVVLMLRASNRRDRPARWQAGMPVSG